MHNGAKKRLEIWRKAGDRQTIGLAAPALRAPAELARFLEYNLQGCDLIVGRLVLSAE